MWRKKALVLGLLSGLVAGCVDVSAVRSPSWMGKWRMFQGPTGRDVVVMDVAILERPLGDHYINEDFWKHADEQAIALERKAMLADNGFRIGQVGGITPEGLQALLTSERSCARPRRLQLHAGNPTALPIGPPLPQCHFEIHQEEQQTPVTLENAQCVLTVVPSLTSDGRTRLHFTPEVQHGESQQQPRPLADRSGWEMNKERPAEKYPALGWEVTLAPNEYIVVGARYDRPQTLGHRCFVRKDTTPPVQQLLVIRTTRPTEGVVPETTAAFAGRVPPLAFQATSSTIRGQD